MSDAPRISHVTGRRQAIALRWIMRVAIVLAAVSFVAPAPFDGTTATAALVLVAATPVARIGWLIFRWSQERDLRFVAVGVLLLAVVATGALVSALGLAR